jgi:hypothetical protein
MRHVSKWTMKDGQGIIQLGFVNGWLLASMEITPISVAGVHYTM